MIEVDQARIEQALDKLPLLYHGPGGVAAFVKDGKVIARRAWGYADLNRRHPMTRSTRLPICSISKQFTCAVLLDQVPDLATLDARVAEYLPQFKDPLPTVKELCHNQSGLRDYWALTVLQGALPEGLFRREDALPLLARMKTGHFPAGTAYSYCNCNFRILAELIETTTGRTLSDLYSERVFGPAGMASAELLPDTRVTADGVVGYEGNEITGYLPASNAIYWIGDAGISASLDDMIAWETYIDATRYDPDGLYRRLSAPPTFRDGTPATYGYGLKHETIAGLKTTGHAGALRGFRAHRLHVASERISVVVLFNHEADAHGAASWLLETGLGYQAPAQTRQAPGWDGLWLDEQQGLVLRTTKTAEGLTLSYGTVPEQLSVMADGSARVAGLSLERKGDAVVMRRGDENLTVEARPLTAVAQGDGSVVAGQYWSDELEAHLDIEARDGAVFAGFSGLLGSGPMEPMYPVGTDVWVISTRRSLDSYPPGDWTVRLRRDENGAVSGLTLGCWLARGLVYRRAG